MKPQQPPSSRIAALSRYPWLRLSALGLRARRRRHSLWPIASADEPAPPVSGFDRDTPLFRLPILSLDTEATGMDPHSDRILSIAAVPLIAGRLYLDQALDRLINPHRPIPWRVTRIHHIADRHVRDAAGFAAFAALLERRLAGHLLLGHNIHFDAALLRQEMRRVGRDWQIPPLLDTMLLFAVLHPHAATLSLDFVAKRLRVSLEGRHTAMGDALIALDLYHRLLPLLAAQGISTLGAAEEASAAALARLRERHRGKRDQSGQQDHAGHRDESGQDDRYGT